MKTALGEISGWREANSTSVEMSPIPMSQARLAAIGRTSRRLDRHIQAKLTKISALESVIESGGAAVGGKIEHHADLREILRVCENGRGIEQ